MLSQPKQMLCKKEAVMQLIVKILLGPFIFKSSNCRQALGQIQDQKKAEKYFNYLKFLSIATCETHYNNRSSVVWRFTQMFHALNLNVIKAATKSGTQENLTTGELQRQRQRQSEQTQFNGERRQQQRLHEGTLAMSAFGKSKEK